MHIESQLTCHAYLLCSLYGVSMEPLLVNVVPKQQGAYTTYLGTDCLEHVRQGADICTVHLHSWNDMLRSN